MSVTDMDTTHRIEHVALDINFGSEEDALTQHVELGAFVSSGLMPVVEEVFHDWSDQEHVFRIDQLEIDLGTVAYDGYQQEMVRRLRGKLASLLPDQLASLKARKVANTGMITRKDSARELVEYFLQHGYLPWNAQLKHHQIVDHLLASVLNGNGQQFVNFLQKSLQHTTVVKRLVRQSSETTLVACLQKLAPVRCEEFLRWISEIHDVFAIPEFPRQILTMEIWETIITILLKDNGASFDRTTMVRLIVGRMCQRQHLTESEVWPCLMNRVAKVEREKGRSLEFTVILKEMNPDNTDGVQERTVVHTKMNGQMNLNSQNDPDRKPSEMSGRRREAIIEYIVQGNAKGLSSLWPELVQQHDEFLREVLREQGQRATVRRSLAEGFPESMLADMVRLFAPDDKPRFDEVRHMLGALWLAANTTGKDHAQIKRHLWIFTLAYLFLKQRSGRAYVSYLHSLLRQMTVHDPAWFHDLPQRLQSVVVPPGIQDEGRQVLDETQEWLRNQQMAQAETELKNTDLIRSYDLYETLRHSFLYAETDGGNPGKEWLNVANELRQKYPGQLLRLYRDLQAGELLYDHVGTRLSAEQLHWLVHTFSTLSPSSEMQSESSGLSELSQAIDGYADTARDAKRYYEQILRCLVSDVIIDFEQIIAANHADVHVVSDTSPAEALHQVLENVLSDSYWLPVGTPSELLRVIETYGSQVSDLKGFYSLVLECLAMNTAIDFEAILRKLRSVAGPLKSSLKEDELDRGLQRDSPELEKSPLSGITPWEQVTHYLQSGQDVIFQEVAVLKSVFARIFEEQPERLRRFLETALEDKESADRLMYVLPDRLMVRVLSLLRQAEHAQIQRIADLIADACVVQESHSGRAHVRRLKWQFILKYFFTEGRMFHEEDFVQSFVSYLSKQLNWPDAQTFRGHVSQHLVRNIFPSTRDQHLRVLKILANQTTDVFSADQPTTTTRAGKKADQAHLDPANAIYVVNAGLVLGAPYFPRLFALLNLMTEAKFLDDPSAERAVHLLQFMVNEHTDSPEHQLVLNKILCGIPISVPIEREITMLDYEREAVEGLIQGMIHNWTRLGKTSMAGLRESFFQREGKLELRDQAWHLSVEQRVFDMLLDHVPWTFATIKFPWMERVLYVEWR